MFSVRLIGRPSISQLGAFRGGPEKGSGNMTNRPRGPPEMREKRNIFSVYSERERERVHKVLGCSRRKSYNNEIDHLRLITDS